MDKENHNTEENKERVMETEGQATKQERKEEKDKHKVHDQSNEVWL